MRFDWDERKATSNLRKHHVGFEDAITALDDPFALIAPDSKHSATEERRWLIGESEIGVVVVVFTPAAGPRLPPYHRTARQQEGEVPL